MDNKVTLVVKLEPPLPERRFLMVCKQRTVKELRNEIKRRILAITTEPLTLLHDGFELMDDDEVTDLLENRSVVAIHVAGASAAPTAGRAADASPRRSPATISRKEHGDAGHRAKGARTFVAESVYDSSQPVSPPARTDSGDSSGSEPRHSDSGGSSSSNSSDSDAPPQAQALGRASPAGRAGRISGATEASLDAAEAVEAAALCAGALVAYKMLEMNEDLSPSVSHYRIAEVVRVADNAIDVSIVRELKPASPTASSKSAKRRRALLLADAEPTEVTRLDPKFVAELKLLS
ncbi:hypothetical protein H4R18_000468 [Coemansia javaensis]|uniref:Ubiquitin-like domain-containing protein n=1 Tax=Coemansia javaensis TaxID=2761396 RepID=A0A9W8HNH2_9FUNG|nr:hypothetical protein H4R18_000468 [Coemansia javaensis]